MKEFKLIKPRARTEIIFKEDKDDEWFIHIITVEKKSGKKSSAMIIQKDMEEFKKFYMDKGWVEFSGEEIKKTVKKTPKKKVIRVKNI